MPLMPRFWRPSSAGDTAGSSSPSPSPSEENEASFTSSSCEDLLGPAPLHQWPVRLEGSPSPLSSLFAALDSSSSSSTASTASTKTVMCLPDEVLVHVLRYLPVPDQASCAVLCKRFAGLLRDRQFVSLHEARFQRRQHSGVPLTHSVTKAIRTAKLPWAHTRPSIKQTLRELKDELGLVAFDGSHCNDIDPEHVSTIRQFRNLRTLDLSYNKRITNESIIDLLTSLRHLDRLVLRKCASLNDGALDLPLDVTSPVSEIDVRMSNEVSGMFLYRSDQCFPRLRSLLMSQLNDRTAALLPRGTPALEELIVLDTHHLTGPGFTAISFVPTLTTIKLYRCFHVQETNVVQFGRMLPHLRSLVLKGNRIQINVGALQELNHLKVFRLSWKSTLQSRELIELSTSFRQLTKLNLSGCKFLDDDSLQSLAHLPLTIIKLLDVPNITDRGYDVILQLPRLVKLVTGWTMDDELTDAPPLPQQLGRRSSSLASLFVRPPRTNSNEDSFSAMTSPTSSFMSPSSVHVPPLSLSSSVHELPTRLSFSGNSLSNDSIHLVPGSTGFLLATATTAITSLSSSDELSTPSSTASSRRSSNLGLQGWRSRSHQLHDITEEPLLSPNDNGPGLATPHSPLRLTFIEGLAKPGAPHLQILRLHHHGNKDLLNRSVAIAAISQLSSLRELHLCAWGVTDEDAVHLARLTDLDTLVLSQSDLTSKGLKVLGDRLRSLYRLDLRLSNRLVCRNGEGLSYFGGPHRVLHSVCLAGCEALDPTALRAFVHMPNLHVLDLSMTRVRPFDLLHLVGISTLRKLSLSACKHIVAVQALRVLHDAQHLHSIDMLGCPFDELRPNNTSRETMAQYQWDYLRRPFVKVLVETITDASRAVVISPYL